MTTTTVTVSVEVDSATLDTWTKYLLTSDEIFRQVCTGYWARPIKWDLDRGWLIFDAEAANHPRRGEEPRRELALEVWKNTPFTPETGFQDIVRLPPHYHCLIHHSAKQAWGIVLLKGEHWHDQHDGSLVDRILQRTLLGSVKYG